MSYQKNCPHEWKQPAPFIPNWVRETPKPNVCPQPIPPVTPNPVFPNTAALQMCNPLQIEKIDSCSVLITISVPAESIIHLPTKALEIKTIKKDFKLTQNHYFNSAPTPPGISSDTPKLFIGGLVRKDIQYSEAVHQTPTTVAGVIKDFVVDIPISCVIDLGRHLQFSPIHYDQQREYGFTESSTKDPLQSKAEFNLLSEQFYNRMPTCQLVFCQINETDNALDCIPLYGGPSKEYTFTTLQEKMVILIQLRLTFPTPIDYKNPHCNPDNESERENNHCYDKDSKHNRKNKSPNSNALFSKINTLLTKLTCIIKGPHLVALLLCK
ncbi:hypothetical protein [Desulfosporosinus meridiei]|uniref:DUF7852 domain-containing protein n=1 Tax=Desulfosporosinus meridiei (strain ATCC BAA-275 / DSM 13257 / KCTC 12902 / NCIMB 13706 / S10) TaxID=768704 RepID=J7ITH8_DESMD|nr:hypothetical protein [Desulfosporosinus meridiei]AFQ42398.1 hypothetical protein Desmer_0337 [Desulfosporosinus meridiei DSM 13257]